MGIPVQEFTPSRGNDKMVRVQAIADLFSSGMVWAPDTRWAREVIEEVAAFPVGENDDYVDTTSQALLRFRQGGFITLDTDEPDEPRFFKRRSTRLLLRTNMATNIDKALYQQPQGIDALAQEQPDEIEIEIIDPEEINIRTGDLDIQHRCRGKKNEEGFERQPWQSRWTNSAMDSIASGTWLTILRTTRTHARTGRKRIHKA
jgi:hypothetical protein